MHKNTVCRMEFMKDSLGGEILLKDGKFQVMMEWEKPYMHACIDALAPQGDVLEIGFGCGYSATHIQSYHPKSHTIIEYHPAVVEKAREWALRYPNVRIVHDTWQNALSNLGYYDCIFFDDYPLESESEMQKLKEQAKASSSLLANGQKLMAEVLELVPFLHSVQYTDADLMEFLQGQLSQQNVNGKHLGAFIAELEHRQQIDARQRQVLWNALEERGYPIEKKRAENPYAFERRGDRFFEFLERCLQNHMRDGSRFSCYFEDPTSKYQDPVFFEKIIANPYLEYREEWISVDVPEHCLYYAGSEALVMTVTKRE